MSDEVPLRQYLERVVAESDLRLSELVRAHERVHNQEEKTRDSLHAGIDSRLHEMNRLRDEVIADRSLFVSRETFEARANALDARIDALHDQVIEWRGREKGLSLTASMIVGAVGFVATILAIYFALQAA
jgi:hypothetical protein